MTYQIELFGEPNRFCKVYNVLFEEEKSCVRCMRKVRISSEKASDGSYCSRYCLEQIILDTLTSYSAEELEALHNGMFNEKALSRFTMRNRIVNWFIEKNPKLIGEVVSE